MAETDEAIYCRFLKSRDEDALRLLFDRHRESLILFLHGFVRNMEDAEDLMMNTFAVVASGAYSFSEKKSSFKTWLFAIGRNQARVFLRKRFRENTAQMKAPPGEEETPEIGILQEEKNRELHHALETLPDDYHQALYLLYFEQMSQDDACIVMRKTKRQMYHLAERGRKALRDALERMGFDHAQFG